MKKVVVFDFDGTLSASDATFEFWRYAARRSVRPWIFLPCTVFGRLLTKTRWFRTSTNARNRTLMYGYISKKLIARIKDGFVKEHSLRRFGWAAEQVSAERKAGNYVVLISAGFDWLIKSLVKDMEFDLVLASVTDKKRPGKVKFPCFKTNKVIALDSAMKSKYKIVRSYSDSKNDLPIMSLADEQIWIDPRTGCRKLTVDS